MAGSLLLLVSCRNATLFALLALAIAFLSFLRFPPPSFHSFQPPASLLNSVHIFVLSNFIILAILISSGSLQLSTFFSFNYFPAQPHTSGEGTLHNRRPPTELAFPKEIHSELRVVVPAPSRRQLVIMPLSSELRTPHQSHLHHVKNLPLAITTHPANVPQPTPAIVPSAATGARILRRRSDRGKRSISGATDVGKTLRKVETTISSSVVFRPRDCGSSMDAMDRLLVSNALLSSDDFHKKCEDFIAKVHFDMRKNL